QVWSSRDAADLLRAQLSLPLPDPNSGTLGSPGRPSIGALLADPATPLPELVSIKNWAKGWSREPDAPGEVALVIYLCAIAAALNGGHRRVRGRSEEKLTQHFAWALAQRWVDPPVRALLRRGAEALRIKRPSR